MGKGATKPTTVARLPMINEPRAASREPRALTARAGGTALVTVTIKARA
jgi:hypothetical protein